MVQQQRNTGSYDVTRLLQCYFIEPLCSQAAYNITTTYINNRETLLALHESLSLIDA